MIASVIVLASNDKQYLEACLSSLLDQDMAEDDYEVIFTKTIPLRMFPPISLLSVSPLSELSGLKGIMVSIKITTMVKACHPPGVPLNFGGYNERDAPIVQGLMYELPH